MRNREKLMVLCIRKERLYILKDKKLRIEIIWLHHDIPIGGHRGQWKTVELVTRNFWQPGVTKKMKQYVEGYNTYQHNKNHTEQPAGKLMPNSIPEKPWSHILADFITKLLLAQEYNSILVVVDRLTKQYILFLLQKRHRQKDQLGCLETTCRSYIGYLRVLYQTGNFSSWQE